MSKKLNGYYTYTHPEGGVSQTFGPDDELPDWAAEQVQDEHTTDDSSDGVADLPVPGPGQVAGEGLTDEQKAEARKAADRERKRRAREAAKAEQEQADQLAAAQEAERQRQAEAEAEAERERQAQGQS